MARQSMNKLSATEDNYLVTQVKQVNEVAFSQLFDKHFVTPSNRLCSKNTLNLSSRRNESRTILFLEDTLK